VPCHSLPSTNRKSHGQIFWYGDKVLEIISRFFVILSANAVQGGVTSQDALSLQNIFRKRDLSLVALLRHISELESSNCIQGGVESQDASSL